VLVRAPAGPTRFLIALIFIILPLGLVAYKFHRSGYNLENLVPVESYDVTTQMTMVGHGDSIRVRTFLPRENSRLTLSHETATSDLPGYYERAFGGNRLGEWSGPAVQGPRSIRVSYRALPRAVTYTIDAAIHVPGPPSTRDNPLLQATPTVQVDDPEIAALAQELAPAGTPALSGLRAIHDYCRRMKTVSFKGTTDALTALRLGEASCNGKSRLFIALARHQGMPSRLVGGLILTPGTKRTSHQWVEVKFGPHWVPFCPTNDYFAALPATYLPLYRGDLVLFSHTTDVNFNYRFDVKRELAIRSELRERGGNDPLSLMSIWNTFEQAGIPMHLLKVILMIPLGALVLVIFRNVIGVQTFGTFLPVLIAVAAREIGLGWGLLAFLLLIGLVLGVRVFIARLQLLHLPQMAILLTFVILFMLTLAVIGVRGGKISLVNVSLFPIAILAITTERFALMIEEEGIGRTLRVTLMTALTIAACYMVMNALTFQILFLSFPELIFLVVFLDIWLGHWMGLRLLEYWRFRHLFGDGDSGHAVSGS
jgi:transglutaminase-like putative cysteine protease